MTELALDLRKCGGCVNEDENETERCGVYLRQADLAPERWSMLWLQSMTPYNDKVQLRRGFAETRSTNQKLGTLWALPKAVRQTTTRRKPENSNKTEAPRRQLQRRVRTQDVIAETVAWSTATIPPIAWRVKSLPTLFPDS